MKTLFIIPKFPTRTYPGKTMGPDYLARALINHANIPKEDIEILDLDILGDDVLEERLTNEDYDLVGISFLSFQTDEAMGIVRKTDSILKQKGRRDTKAKNYAPIVVGGHGTSQCDEIVPLFQEVDAWAIDEGLETIVDLANAIRRGTFLQDRKHIAGIKYYDSGKVILTRKRGLIKNLDDYLPLRLHHYLEYDFDVFNYKKTAQLMSQTDCAGTCIFCHESLNGRNIRERSLGSIEAEIKGLIVQGYKSIYFDDSTFTWNRKRTIKIVELMKRFHEQNGIGWGFNTRVDCLDKELIQIIKDSGCAYMFAGVESLEPQVLAGMNKVSTYHPSPDYPYYKEGKAEEEYIRAAKQAFKWMSEVGLTKSCFLIFGGPTLSYESTNRKRKAVRGIETFEQAKRTINQAVWELDPEYISINIMRFIPDAVMSSSKAFAYFRGQKERIHAGHFSNEWKQQHGLSTEEFRQNPIYMAYEAAGKDYPIPPNMTSEYCYSILQYLVEQVNLKKQRTEKQTTIVVDKTFQRFMPKDEEGIYHLKPFKELRKTE